MKKILLTALLLSACSLTPEADQPPVGTAGRHRIDWETYRLDPAARTAMEKAGPFRGTTRGIVPGINGIVFGYYPYWMGSAYDYQDWSLITHTAYFSADFNTSGNFDSRNGWPDGATATGLRNAVRANGGKLFMTVVAFYTSIHNAILQNPGIQQTAISNIIDLVISGDADGINIDFEGVGSSNRNYFTAFITNLRAQLQAARPGAMITLAMPAVDWAAAFDLAALEPYTDLFFIMGYDYHWSSGIPGAVAYLSTSYNLTKSVQYYKSGISDHSKIVAGMPYYGIDWPSVSGDIGAAQTANGTSVLYKNTINHEYSWDTTSLSPWYPYLDGSQWHQLWFENWRSIEKKIQMIKSEGIGGMGMWALGYDGSASDLWTVINKYFNDDYSAPAGSILNPFIISSFPYSNSADTTGAEKAFDYYPSVSTVNETGPDHIYQMEIPAAGSLSATVTDGTGVDIDIHLLSSLSADACVVRNDSTFTCNVTPGTWYIVADSWSLDSYAGAYTLDVTFTATAGSHLDPHLITSLPFSINSSTVGKESLISNYLPFSGTPEGGPEETYLLHLDQGGRITITVTDGIGVDIDIHLLTSLDPATCFARNDSVITMDLGPGDYYIIADTWTDAGYAGDYTLTVSAAAPLLSAAFDGNLDGWTLSSAYTAVLYTGSLKYGSGALRLQDNAWASTSINTTGKTNISLACSMATAGMETGGRLIAEYNTGSGWTEAAVLGISNVQMVYRDVLITLPAEAENNPALGLRFRLEGNGYGFVDRVAVNGD